MSIITRSYFDGIALIANATDSDPDKNLLGNANQLDNYIRKYEREVLIKCLGYPLYKIFLQQFTVDANGHHILSGGALAKWGQLLNGYEYTIGIKTYNWRGLVFSDTIAGSEVYQQSLIAYYVYAQFVYHTEYQHSGIGFQSEEAKNAKRVSARAKYVGAMNEFYKLASSDMKTERSLRQFIKDRNGQDPTLYPDWEMESIKPVNRFGL